MSSSYLYIFNKFMLSTIHFDGVSGFVAIELRKITLYILVISTLMYSKVLMLLKCKYFQLVSRIFYNFKLFFCHGHFSLG